MAGPDLPVGYSAPEVPEVPMPPDPSLMDKLTGALTQIFTGAVRGNTTDLLGTPGDISHSIASAVGLPVNKDSPIGSNVVRSKLGIQPTEEDSLGNFLGSFMGAGAVKSGFLAVAKASHVLSAMFIPTALGTNAGNRLKASQMEKLGKTGEEIWNATGIVRNPIDKEMMSVLDSRTAYVMPVLSQNGITHKTRNIDGSLTYDSTITHLLDTRKGPAPLTDVLHFPELFAAMTGTGFDKVKIQTVSTLAVDSAHYSPTTGIITMGPATSLENFTSTLIHEVQHAVQDVAGLRSGGNPSQFYTDKNLFDVALVKARKSMNSTAQILEQSLPNHVTLSMVVNNPELQKTYPNTVNSKTYTEFLDKKSTVEALEQYKNIAYDLYKKLSGEAQARAAENIHKQGIGKTLPTNTIDKGGNYDIPVDKLIDPNTDAFPRDTALQSLLQVLLGKP
jgi:hypothetical protein